MNEDDDPCAIVTNDRRWYLVAVVGTSLSFASFLCNLVIAKVLLSSHHAHFFFLALLAISDAFLSFMYGPVIAMDVIKDRWQILWLTQSYWQYIGPLLSLCQVSMTFSCYLIILATIERYLITQRSPWLPRFRRCRGLMALLMFLLSMLLRGTIVFEIEIQKNFNCTGLTEFAPGLSDLVYTKWYGTVFRFYLRTITTVFLPFFLLAYLNYIIVRTLRRQQRSAQMFRFLSTNHKEKIRSATRLMVIIVCSYLLANVLNVFITLWEYVSFSSTQTTETFAIYELCTDIVSVLYVLVCATRLPVYYFSNQEIREEIKCFFGKIPEKRIDDEEKQMLKHHRSITFTPPNLGTNVDAITIAIARRLVDADGNERPGSPLQAIVFANAAASDRDETAQFL